MLYICFFFNDSATPEIYTLSLHDALPIYIRPFETYVEIVRAKRFVLAGHPDGLVTVRFEIVHEGLSVTQVRDGAGKHMMSRLYCVTVMRVREPRRNASRCERVQIGRASCRERVYIRGVGVSLE